MIIFIVLAMMVIGFMWKNITVYDYTQTSSGPSYYSQHWGLDRDSSRRLPLTPLRIIMWLLLLVPWFNIAWFIILIIQIAVKASYPDDPHECTIWVVEIKENSPRLAKMIRSISEFLNRELT